MNKRYAMIAAVFSTVILTLSPAPTVSAREKPHPDKRLVITEATPAPAETPAYWVDDLYEKMVAGDGEAVFAIISAPDFAEKCSAFAHEEIAWSTDYNLLTSDGKVIWALIGLEKATVDVLYCANPEHSNVCKEYGYGDYAYFMDEVECIETGEKDFDKYWIVFDQYYMFGNSTPYPVEPGEIDGVLHM